MRYDKVMAIITILLVMGIGESVISFRMGTIHGQRGADRYYAEHPHCVGPAPCVEIGASNWNAMAVSPTIHIHLQDAQFNPLGAKTNYEYSDYTCKLATTCYTQASWASVSVNVTPYAEDEPK